MSYRPTSPPKRRVTLDEVLAAGLRHNATPVGAWGVDDPGAAHKGRSWTGRYDNWHILDPEERPDETRASVHYREHFKSRIYLAGRIYTQIGFGAFQDYLRGMTVSDALRKSGAFISVDESYGDMPRWGMTTYSWLQMLAVFIPNEVMTEIYRKEFPMDPTPNFDQGGTLPFGTEIRTVAREDGTQTYQQMPVPFQIRSEQLIRGELRDDFSMWAMNVYPVLLGKLSQSSTAAEDLEIKQAILGAYTHHMDVERAVQNGSHYSSDAKAYASKNLRILNARTKDLNDSRSVGMGLTDHIQETALEVGNAFFKSLHKVLLDAHTGADSKAVAMVGTAMRRCMAHLQMAMFDQQFWQPACGKEYACMYKVKRDSTWWNSTNKPTTTNGRVVFRGVRYGSFAAVAGTCKGRNMPVIELQSGDEILNMNDAFVSTSPTFDVAMEYYGAHGNDRTTGCCVHVIFVDEGTAIVPTNLLTDETRHSGGMSPYEYESILGLGTRYIVLDQPTAVYVQGGTKQVLMVPLLATPIYDDKGTTNIVTREYANRFNVEMTAADKEGRREYGSRKPPARDIEGVRVAKDTLRKVTTFMEESPLALLTGEHWVRGIGNIKPVSERWSRKTNSVAHKYAAEMDDEMLRLIKERTYDSKLQMLVDGPSCNKEGNVAGGGARVGIEAYVADLDATYPRLRKAALEARRKFVYT